MSKVGERIKVLRIKRGITQSQLADAMNLKRSAIGNYEQGIREPDLDTIEAFADYFDVSLADIMGRDEGIVSQSDIADELRVPVISDIEFALSGEIHELSEAEMQDVLDYVRFKRAQKAKEAKP